MVPVSVWKHVNRNLSVSRNSIPEGGTEGFGSEYAEDEVDVDGALGVVPVGVELPEGEDAVAEGAICAVGSLGVMERVIAWTLLFIALHD